LVTIMTVETFIICIIVGFAAQFIDGAAGMAYGVSCRSFLRFSLKLPVAVCSAVVHIAELPLTLVSGLSHLKMRNVDGGLLALLLVPGMVGAAIGAALVSYSNDFIEIVVDMYLILIGVRIFIQSFGKSALAVRRLPSWLKCVIAALGGFFDAFGGGGWGPIVTSTLLANEQRPQRVIGTVNTAEFGVTAVQALFFGIFVQSLVDYWWVVVAVIVGGIVAAPISAKLCVKMPRRTILLLVGALIVALNAYGLYNLLFA